jgi:hypothetical protein
MEKPPATLRMPLPFARAVDAALRNFDHDLYVRFHSAVVWPNAMEADVSGDGGCSRPTVLGTFDFELLASINATFENRAFNGLGEILYGVWTLWELQTNCRCLMEAACTNSGNEGEALFQPLKARLEY